MCGVQLVHGHGRYVTHRELLTFFMITHLLAGMPPSKLLRWGKTSEVYNAIEGGWYDHDRVGLVVPPRTIQAMNWRAGSKGWDG